MKRLFFAALTAVLVGTSAFAADIKDASKVSYKVRTIFDAKFNGASNIEWTLREDYTKASFILADQQVEAFFSTEGELIATSRKVEFSKLPLNAIQSIQKKYAAYTVSETIEMDQDGEKSYYVSLQKNDRKQILQVSFYGTVSVYRAGK